MFQSAQKRLSLSRCSMKTEANQAPDPTRFARGSALTLGRSDFSCGIHRCFMFASLGCGILVTMKSKSYEAKRLWRYAAVA